MFQLTPGEFKNLIFHFGTSSWGGTRKPPYVFTEYGVAMLSGILTSERAIQVNIQIIKAFIKLKEILSTHKELKEKIEAMEGKYDQQFKVVFDALKRLLEAPKEESQKIKGFELKE